MEGLVRGIVAALFIFLVILGIIVFAYSFATPLKFAEHNKNASSTDRIVVVEKQTVVEKLLSPEPVAQPVPQPVQNPVPAPVAKPTPEPVAQPALPTPPPAPQPPVVPQKPTYPATAIGTSAIHDGVVVTVDGTPVDNSLDPGSPKTPLVSNPVKPDQYPKDAVILKISSEGFSPNSFTVKRGSAITLIIVSGDTQTHVFRFNDSSLNAIAVGVGGGEARAITFNAPNQVIAAGYGFHCDVPGHASRGESGIMQVQ